MTLYPDTDNKQAEYDAEQVRLRDWRVRTALRELAAGWRLVNLVGAGYTFVPPGHHTVWEPQRRANLTSDDVGYMHEQGYIVTTEESKGMYYATFTISAAGWTII